MVSEAQLCVHMAKEVQKKGILLWVSRSSSERYDIKFEIYVEKNPTNSSLVFIEQNLSGKSLD